MKHNIQCFSGDEIRLILDSENGLMGAEGKV